jgi:hypothetical protein
MVSTDAASLSRCSRLQVSTVLWGLVSLGAPPVGGLFKVQSQRFPYFVIGHFVAPTGPKPKRASGRRETQTPSMMNLARSPSSATVHQNFCAGS